MARKTLVIGVILVAVTLVSLRAFGLVRPFRIPTGAMTPALTRGDHFMMENLTFLARPPRRGDIVVFKTDRIPTLPQGVIYVKRIVGLPGDELRISNGNLYANGTHIRLENAAGDIRYVFIPGAVSLTSPADAFKVPEGHYFMLGDNSRNSADSRFHGPVPAQNILGRAWFRYSPPNRIGFVR